MRAPTRPTATIIRDNSATTTVCHASGDKNMPRGRWMTPRAAAGGVGLALGAGEARPFQPGPVQPGRKRGRTAPAGGPRSRTPDKCAASSAPLRQLYRSRNSINESQRVCECDKRLRLNAVVSRREYRIAVTETSSRLFELIGKY